MPHGTGARLRSNTSFAGGAHSTARRQRARTAGQILYSARSEKLGQPSPTPSVQDALRSAQEPSLARPSAKRTVSTITLEEAHEFLSMREYDLLPLNDARQRAHWDAQGVPGSPGYCSPSHRRLLLSDGVRQSPTYRNASAARSQARRRSPTAVELATAHALLSSKGFLLLPLDDERQQAHWEAQAIPESPEYRWASHRRLLLSDGVQQSPNYGNVQSGRSQGIRTKSEELTLEAAHGFLADGGFALLPLSDPRQRAHWETQGVPGSSEYRSPSHRQFLLRDGVRLSPTYKHVASTKSRNKVFLQKQLKEHLQVRRQLLCDSFASECMSPSSCCRVPCHVARTTSTRASCATLPPLTTQALWYDDWPTVSSVLNEAERSVLQLRFGLSSSPKELTVVSG